jgi:hypothetical protein
MRYKIKTESDSQYREVLSVLEGSEARVLVTSPRRRMVGIEDLPSEVRSAVEARGGRIVVDQQYDLEQEG